MDCSGAQSDALTPPPPPPPLPRTLCVSLWGGCLSVTALTFFSGFTVLLPSPHEKNIFGSTMFCKLNVQMSFPTNKRKSKFT